MALHCRLEQDRIELTLFCLASRQVFTIAAICSVTFNLVVLNRQLYKKYSLRPEWHCLKNLFTILRYIGCADAGSAPGWHSASVRFVPQHTLCLSTGNVIRLYRKIVNRFSDIGIGKRHPAQ